MPGDGSRLEVAELFALGARSGWDGLAATVRCWYNRGIFVGVCDFGGGVRLPSPLF